VRRQTFGYLPSCRTSPPLDPYQIILLDDRGTCVSILWSHHEETRELPGERDNARNNARCTQARKATHGLDGQHQDVDRTLHGRVNQNDRDKWRKYVHGVANPRIEDG